MHNTIHKAQHMKGNRFHYQLDDKGGICLPVALVLQNLREWKGRWTSKESILKENHSETSFY